MKEDKQDIIDNGALYIALLVTIVTEVADGRPRNEQTLLNN